MFTISSQVAHDQWQDYLEDSQNQVPGHSKQEKGRGGEREARDMQSLGCQKASHVQQLREIKKYRPEKVHEITSMQVNNMKITTTY